ncbi:MAG: hypothetical protein IAF02_02825 [Anaerolineae bacterium]|nr:hypothetical protein [Anaerolineae bacterium]
MIGVECTFAQNGRCHIKRIQIKDDWVPVEQGRQWVDRQGRHVLVRVPGQPVQEILLKPDTLTWELVNGRSDIQIV